MSEPKGLSAGSIKILRESLEDILQTKYRWKIWVFGSRRRGDYRKYSDLDLLIDSEPPLRPEDLEELDETFLQSDLPIKVDIVTPENIVPAYKPSIEAEKCLWLSSGAD